MPVTIKLGRFFDKKTLNAAIKEAMGKTLDDFVEYIGEQQDKETHTGVVRTIRGKKHRASARGERPAKLSGKLRNSTKKKRLGNFKGEVTTIAKRKGFDYAEQLQEKLGRPIQDERDRKVGEKMLADNMEKALNKIK